MQERVEVKAVRIPDRDRLLETLKSEGLDARPVDEVGLEVSCGGDADEASDRVLAHVESVVLDLGAPFVPVKHDGVVYLRPPTD
jgi:hypothetical protein